MEDIHYFKSETNQYKRFLVFQYDDHYPTGGLSDAVSFDTLEEALNEVKRTSYINIQLFDCVVRKEVDITKYGVRY